MADSVGGAGDGALRGPRGRAWRGRWGRAVVGTVVVVLILSLAALWVRLSPRTAVPAAQARPATSAELNAFLRRESVDLGLPGIAVTVLRPGVADYAGFVGTTTSGRAVGGTTPFVLGSTSKQLTGLAVQRLVSDGRLSLDAPVGGILPAFGGGDKARVRVQDLLAQTSGFSTTTGVAQWGWRPDSPRSIQDGAAQLATETLDRDPGSAFEYSNANYDVLGAVVEKVSGEPYADALRDLVLAPLGMDHTTARPPATGETGGFSTWFGLVTVPTPAPTTPGGVPSSFVTSTAEDLTRLVQAHLATRQTAFPQSVLDASRRPLVRVSQYAQYASGWFVRPLWEEHPLDADPLDAGLPTCVSHDGTAYRSMSFLLACPGMGFGVVALTDVGQGADAGRWTQFQEDLIHLALGTPAPVLSRDLVQVEAPVILLGALLVQLVAAGSLVLAVARRRPFRARGLLAAAVSLALLGLGWGYAPNATGTVTPLPALWASVPDLGTATVLATGLAVVTLMALWVGVRRRSRSPAGVRAADVPE